jgi:hypothetical protein
MRRRAFTGIPISPRSIRLQPRQSWNFPTSPVFSRSGKAPRSRGRSKNWRRGPMSSWLMGRALPTRAAPGSRRISAFSSAFRRSAAPNQGSSGNSRNPANGKETGPDSRTREDWSARSSGRKIASSPCSCHRAMTSTLKARCGSRSRARAATGYRSRSGAPTGCRNNRSQALHRRNILSPERSIYYTLIMALILR